MSNSDANLGKPASSAAQNLDSFAAAATRVGDVAICSMASHPPGGRAEAPNVVLVHGLGLSQRSMMPLAQELARDCNLYVPDQPDFDGSGHPERVPDMVGLADALADWMRTTGLVRAALVGNSQGCQIIAQLAVQARIPYL